MDAPEDQGGNSLWLKSEYNNVWKHIDLHKVWTKMLDGRDIEKSPIGHIRDIKLSLKRFRNLGEINNGYNADILRALHVEEEVAELHHQDVEEIPVQVTQPRRTQLVRLGANPQTRLNFQGTGSHAHTEHIDDW